MPYYIGDVIKDYKRLVIRTPEDFKKTGIDVRIKTRVDGIDAAKGTVHLSDGSALPYDILVMATGAEAARLGLPGEDLEGVFTLRRLTDALRIKSFMNNNPCRKALIIGAGYIGMEMCEAFRNLGIDTYVLAKYLYGNIGTNTCHQFIEPHLDGLCKLILDAGEDGKRLFELIGQFLLTGGIDPLVLRMQTDDHINLLHRHGVGGYFRSTDTTHDLIYLYKILFQNLLHLCRHLNGFLKRCAGFQYRLYHKVAFIRVGVNSAPSLGKMITTDASMAMARKRMVFLCPQAHAMEG